MSTLLEPSSIREIAERGFGVLAFGTAPDGLTWLTRIDAPPSAEDLLCWRLCRTLDSIVGAR
jgi:hypothetical protein